MILLCGKTYKNYAIMQSRFTKNLHEMSGKPTKSTLRILPHITSNSAKPKNDKSKHAFVQKSTNAVSFCLLLPFFIKY